MLPREVYICHIRRDLINLFSLNQKDTFVSSTCSYQTEDELQVGILPTALPGTNNVLVLKAVFLK